LGALGDHFVGIAGEDGKDLGSVGRRKVCATGADSEFTFALSAAVTQIFDDFRAERFHWVPASNPSG
jgi:hypothetical protein